MFHTSISNYRKTKKVLSFDPHCKRSIFVYIEEVFK